jgi:hypothetical protein
MRKFCRGVGDFCFVSEVLVFVGSILCLACFGRCSISCFLFVCFQRLSSGFCAILRYIFHGCLLRFFFFILGGIVWVSGFELTVSHERCCLSTAEFVASIGS